MEKADPVNLENVTRDRLSRESTARSRWVWVHPAAESISKRPISIPSSLRRDIRPSTDTARAGIDLKTDLVEVAPAAHFMMGGLKSIPAAEQKSMASLPPERLPAASTEQIVWQQRADGNFCVRKDRGARSE